MKRLFLILAICLIIALSAIWGYLLFFGAPESTREFFANFNFGDTEDTTVVLENLSIFENTEDFQIISNETNALRQLTDKPVAGYTEVLMDTGSTTFVYYIEAGTGHIFKLDVISGEEERLSNITIPNAQQGMINRDGTIAIVQSKAPGDGELTVVELAGTPDSASSFLLVSAAHDFTLTEGGEVLYALTANTSLEGYSYDIETKATNRIFTIPFRDAKVLWGEAEDATHYFFPKPASQLEGYLYSVRNGTITREPLGGFGFSAKASSAIILASFNREGEYISVVYDPVTRSQVESTIDFIPEKCSLSIINTAAICAIPDNFVFTSDVLKDWYKGISKNSDELFLINFRQSEIVFSPLINLKEISSREIDAINIRTFEGSSYLYFSNKTDSTSWLLEL